METKILVTKKFSSGIKYTSDFSKSGCHLDVSGIPTFIPKEEGATMKHLDARGALITTNVPKNTILLFVEKCRQVLVHIT